MEKTVFILREVEFAYDDYNNNYAGANNIYKKYKTLAEAQRAKKRLEIDRIKIDINIPAVLEKYHFTGNYKTIVKELIGINHLEYLKNSLEIDFTGLFKTHYFKDFEYKALFEWFSVQFFCHLTKDEPILRKAILKQIDLSEEDLMMQISYLEEILNGIIRGKPYLIQGKTGGNPNDFCRNKFSYAKKNFNLDFEKALASEFLRGIKKERIPNFYVAGEYYDYERYFTWFFDELFNMMVWSSEKHIQIMLDVADIEFYEISEITDDTCFYEIYTNSAFMDFVHFGDVGELKEVFYGSCWVDYTPITLHNDLQTAQNIVGQSLYDMLSGKEALKGSLSELSEAPEIFQSYIESYDYFIYDNENQTLKMRKWDSKQEEQNQMMMRGFMGLLREEKMPLIIKKISISEIEKRNNQNRKNQKIKIDMPPFVEISETSLKAVLEEDTKPFSEEYEKELNEKRKLLEEARLERLRRYNEEQDKDDEKRNLPF